VRFTTVESLADVPAQAWNGLAGSGNPFVRHEFLLALERRGCVGERLGWRPRHLLVHEGGRLVAAAPAYIKHNSYGELVFDWAWAEAYERAGLAYYPKLVVAVPYTPVTGPRLLVEPAHTAARQALVEGALGLVQASGFSSLHWLFTDEGTTRSLESSGLARRVGCQFHWQNPGYRDFQDFLGELSARRRKEIRRERRAVADQGIEVEVLGGREAQAGHWAAMHRFYRSTFDRRGGIPTLTREFFEDIGAHLPDAVVLVLARRGGRYVAGTFNVMGAQALYGRHWGTEGFFPGLHFELCYYQTIEFCIARGLRTFEAGAQGEHKVARGFLPAPTYSAHWIAHPGFRAAVADFVAREGRAVTDYMEAVREHSPFRRPSADPAAPSAPDPVR
jgi:hypothetical protein